MAFPKSGFLWPLWCWVPGLAQQPTTPNCKLCRGPWREFLHPAACASPRRGCRPQVWVLGAVPAREPGSQPPLCVAGRPGLPRELGAADHCPGARGRLHLLPEAAAAPDDRAEQQGRGQWVQLQRHSRSWVCTGYLCSLSPLPRSLPPTPALLWASTR